MKKHYRCKLDIINDKGNRRSFEHVIEAQNVDHAILLTKCLAGMLCNEYPIGSETRLV